MPEIKDMDNLVDYLIPLIQKQFYDDVSYVYYGDIGLYPPQAFKGPSKEERLVVAIIPNFDRPVEGSRSAMSEFREIGVLIGVMVNMTPYFERLPKEAFGERKLVQLTNRIRAFLQQDKNFDLQRQVLTSRVNGIDWDWQIRSKDNNLRTSAIDFQVTIEVDRLEMQ